MKASHHETAAWLKQRLPEVPSVAMILGTGLNAIAERGKTILQIPYGEIPGFVSSTAPSHKGNLVLSELDGQKVLFLQGRFHFYEGHPMSAVVFPTRVLACLGVKTLIVTNASGSLREKLGPGSIVMLEDHINHMGTNPLIGENDADLGERFPSMNHPYDLAYRESCLAIAREQNIPLHSGVYLAVTGPSLETRAECAAFAGWGADLVGMSTVPEVIVARHAGMKVLAFSVVTNHSNLFHDKAHSQEEIRANADRASTHLINLITRFLKTLD
ncbi:MAG: purine-nucleoside phosphorylase [Candidatus Cloacimonadaceae bacterium]|jgi:inosine/guanosine/xanthosine phosphorylase family protein|nr:purine-nucleoside phosphorylase [Candidatus Cloacimonadota bacterium]MDX9949694.1 purine-nucleoside phosphorylase [Candidatus Syntrophosphaera sp.]NLN85158.1 purine-nucleoside phosphorylase [Candidatus Cloacimonadota bacterium]